MSRRAVWLISAIWLTLVAASFIYLALTPATDIGFTRGLNRLMGFLYWQGGAFIAAVAAFVVAWNVAGGTRTDKLIGYFPLGAMIAFYVIVMTIAVVAVSLEVRDESDAANQAPKPTLPAPRTE